MSDLMSEMTFYEIFIDSYKQIMSYTVKVCLQDYLKNTIRTKLVSTKVIQFQFQPIKYTTIST